MTVLHTLFGELSKSFKVLSITSIITLIVLGVIGYFVYKKYFSPLSQFKEYPKKAIDEAKSPDNLFNETAFQLPSTTSNDEVAKIIVDYNKSKPDNKIDIFVITKTKDVKIIQLLSFNPVSGYSKSKLPDLIDNNDSTLWVLK
jgi:uncharacterized protein YpmB